MSEDHTFHTTLQWPAEPAQEKPPAATFSRNGILGSPGHPDIVGGSPPVFGGVTDRYNPEELMTLSLSECHMLTFLSLAAKKQVAVLAYEDRATGRLRSGWNELLAKVTQHTAGCGLTVQITNKDGTAVSGLRFDARAGSPAEPAAKPAPAR